MGAQQRQQIARDYDSSKVRSMDDHRDSFTQLPNRLWTDPDLDAYAKAVYGSIRHRDWGNGCTLDIDQIARESGCKHSKAQRTLRYLQSRTMIRVESLKGRPSIYYALPVNCWTPVLSTPPYPGTEYTPVPHTAPTPVLSTAPPVPHTPLPRSDIQGTPVLSTPLPGTEYRGIQYKTTKTLNTLDNSHELSHTEQAEPVDQSEQAEPEPTKATEPNDDTKSLPYQIAEACVIAQKRPAERRIVVRYLKAAKIEIIDAYHGQGVTLTMVKNCIAYLATDPWYDEDPTRITPTEVGKKMGAWIAKEQPSQFAPAPRGRASRGKHQGSSGTDGSKYEGIFDRPGVGWTV